MRGAGHPCILTQLSSSTSVSRLLGEGSGKQGCRAGFWNRWPPRRCPRPGEDFSAPPESTSCGPAWGNLVQQGTQSRDVPPSTLPLQPRLRAWLGSWALSFDVEAPGSHLQWLEGRGDDFRGLWAHPTSFCPSLIRALVSSEHPPRQSRVPSTVVPPSLLEGTWPPASLLLHPVPTAPRPPHPSLTFSSFAPVPSTLVRCPPGKRNSLLSWLSGNMAWLENLHCHLPPEPAHCSCINRSQQALGAPPLPSTCAIPPAHTCGPAWPVLALLGLGPNYYVPLPRSWKGFPKGPSVFEKRHTRLQVTGWEWRVAPGQAKGAQLLRATHGPQQDDLSPHQLSLKNFPAFLTGFGFHSLAAGSTCQGEAAAGWLEVWP